MTRRFALTLTLTLLLAACGDQDAPAQQAQAPSKPRIALVMKTLTNPFFIEMERGARRAEQELGVELLVRTAAQETSIAQQIGIVDALIREPVDAIVIAPGDSIELIPVLKKAKDAGIAVINIDNRLDPAFIQKLGLGLVPFISVDNEQAAFDVTRLIAEPPTEPTQAAIIEGIRDAANARDRKRGALRAFAENPQIQVVASESANWKVDEGRAVAQQVFEHFPGIELLFCANDMMAIGAMDFLQSAGRSDVRVVSYDALESALEAVRSGALVATVDQQAAEQGYLGVVYALRAINGETLPEETMVESRVIQAGSLQD